MDVGVDLWRPRRSGLRVVSRTASASVGGGGGATCVASLNRHSGAVRRGGAAGGVHGRRGGVKTRLVFEPHGITRRRFEFFASFGTKARHKHRVRSLMHYSGHEALLLIADRKQQGCLHFTPTPIVIWSNTCIAGHVNRCGASHKARGMISPSISCSFLSPKGSHATDGDQMFLPRELLLLSHPVREALISDFKAHHFFQLRPIAHVLLVAAWWGNCR